MKKLKADKELDDWISKNPKGECMIDLHAWVMYIPLGYDKN